MSGLPGNLFIEQYIENKLQLQNEFTLMYIDIDNFKAYNDVYGFERGDLIIKTLANIMASVVPPNEFIGHIGGDDFIAIISSEHTPQICCHLMDEFNRRLYKFYDPSDLDRGYIVSKNRSNVEEAFPLLSLSVSCIVNRNYHSLYEISRKASEVKKKCKQIIGNAYLIE